MPERQSETKQLLRRARKGEDAAAERLFDVHRRMLRHMVALRMDVRMTARIDPSDVVQDALAEAARRFGEYLESGDEQFYPWLRQIAWERLVQLHRHHVQAQKRSVVREVAPQWRLPDESIASLSRSIAANVPSPSATLVRAELQARVRATIEQLSQPDREVLVLRHLEQLSIAEVAAVLRISQAAAQSRYRRSLERLHKKLTNGRSEESLR